MISFAKTASVDDVREVLKGYLKASPGFAKACKAKRAVTLPPSPMKRNAVGLLGKGSTERLLTYLAVHGPTRMATLKEAIRSDLYATNMVKHLEADGFIVIEGDYKSRIVSLDAAHPLYPEKKALLLALADEKSPRRRPPDFRSSRTEFAIDHLFMTRLKRDVLIMLAVAEAGEIDPKSIARACPDRSYCTILQRLHDLEARGIVKSRWRGHMLLFWLDPDYRHHRELLALLEAAARFERRFLTKARLEVRSYRPNRLTMYLNDRKPKREKRDRGRPRGSRNSRP